MNTFNFDPESYLKRIKHSAEPDCNLDSLASLQQAQLQSIPFENFDIFLGKEIKLEPDSLFDKLVFNRRGGYCFELNGLFLMALQSFGFEARALLGRVHISGVPTGRGHQISLVTIDGEQWVVDTGFGTETPSIPIPLKLDEPVSGYGQTFRLKADELFGYMLQSKHGENWIDVYSFELNHVCAGDIECANHFTSTSPKAIFTNVRIAAIRTADGIRTLFDHRVTEVTKGEERVIELEQNDNYIKSLDTYFGIELGADYADLKPVFNFQP